LAANESPFVATPPPGVVSSDRMLALISTSIFGMVYEALPLNEVDHFSVTSQESTR
jgi:hypothetical protein